MSRGVAVAIVPLAALAGCVGTDGPKAAPALSRGFYACRALDGRPFHAAQFVIGEGDSFTSYDDERGVFRPGTHRFKGEVLAFASSPLDGLRLRRVSINPNALRVLDGKGGLTRFACT